MQRYISGPKKVVQERTTGDRKGRLYLQQPQEPLPRQTLISEARRNTRPFNAKAEAHDKIILVPQGSNPLGLE